MEWNGWNGVFFLQGNEDNELKLREDFKCASQRVVIKIGTGVLSSGDGRLDLNVLRDLCGQMCNLHDSGKEIVIVTSGAVASGRARLGIDAGEMDVPLQQASAAVGQSLLMEQYNSFFSRRGKCVAQIPLTQQDFSDEARFRNIVGTLERLLKMRVITIVNENDAVATEELDPSGGKDERLFGDNDVLSTLVAGGIGADSLAILSTVDGLLGEDRRAISAVFGFDGGIWKLDFGGNTGRGGLASKLKAMKKAGDGGIYGVIANGKSQNILERIFAGERVGTIFARKKKETPAQERDYCQKIALLAKESGQAMAKIPEAKRNGALLAAAELIDENSADILKENEADVSEARAAGHNAAFVERLSLGEKGVGALSATLRSVARQELAREKIAEWNVAGGLKITKVRVPLGALLLIFESRPDVTIEGAALAIKSGNAIILKGGKEAARTNHALTGVLQKAGEMFGLPKGAIQVFEGTREDLGLLLKRSDCLDLVAPRGGGNLLRFVRKNSEMPVLSAGGGNCHLYVHEDADAEIALRIALNAKTQKPSACNAIETLLVHEKIAGTFLPMLAERMTRKGVELRCCRASFAMLQGFGVKKATDADWATEFLGLVLAVRVVAGLDEAVRHVNKYGTRHSEAIVTQNKEAADSFCGAVDCACAYWNASTRFSDGGQFGFGAELGISTQKLHVRGPIGLDSLYTYKYKIAGNGNVRG